MTPADLQALLDARAADGCIAALAPLDEARRGKLAKTALAELRSILPVERLSPAAFARMQPDEMQAWLRREAPDPATFRAAQVAVLATASYPQLRRLGRRSLPPLGDALAVLAARRPPWVGEWADLILSWSETDRWALPLADAWVYARGLIRAGLGDRPRTPRYIDGMIVAIGRKGTPRRDLLADPGLLADEVWELFTTEPTPGRREILSVSEYRPPTARWEVALADLAAEGRVDRGRLLDASLDGLERDFHEARARWFALMHETLRPTPQERADRADRLLGLLGSRNASTVLFALKALGPLAEADRLDPGPLLGAIAPALLARPKGTVVLALGLVDRAGGPSAAGTAVDALAHESPAVHRLVVDVVLRHGDRADPALAELVRDRSPGVAASERPRLEAWLGAGPAVVESTSDEVADLIARAATLDPHFATLAGVPAAIAAARRGGGDLAPLRFAAADVPRLDPARRIEPVADLDDLIELFTRVLEGAGAAEDVERLLDGVSRLCDQLPADFAARTAPLRARAAEWGPYGGHLGRLAIAWIDGGPGASRRIHWPDDLFGLFERRAIALADRAIERLGRAAAGRADAPRRLGRPARPGRSVADLGRSRSSGRPTRRRAGVLAARPRPGPAGRGPPGGGRSGRAGRGGAPACPRRRGGGGRPRRPPLGRRRPGARPSGRRSARRGPPPRPRPRRRPSGDVLAPPRPAPDRPLARGQQAGPWSTGPHRRPRATSGACSRSGSMAATSSTSSIPTGPRWPGRRIASRSGSWGSSAWSGMITARARPGRAARSSNRCSIPTSRSGRWPVSCSAGSWRRTSPNSAGWPPTP